MTKSHSVSNEDLSSLIYKNKKLVMCGWPFLTTSSLEAGHHVQCTGVHLLQTLPIDPSATRGQKVHTVTLSPHKALTFVVVEEVDPRIFANMYTHAQTLVRPLPGDMHAV